MQNLQGCKNRSAGLSFVWPGSGAAPGGEEQAAKALRLTSRDLLSLGVIDDVIEEPLGGAHRDHPQMAARLKMYLLRNLKELTAKPLDELVAARYEKFRRMGKYLELPIEA